MQAHVSSNKLSSITTARGDHEIPQQCKFPLSTQKLIWVAQELHPDNPQYNISEIIGFGRAFDATDFERALRLAVNKNSCHPRRIYAVDGIVYQRTDRRKA